MKHTLVAAFDSLSQAQTAKTQLINQKILESNIDISSSDLNTDEGSTASGDHLQARHDDSFGEKVSHFFGSLFGNDDEDTPHRHATAYPEAYRRGATLLTVIVATDDEAELVEDVLEHNGAIDIDERSATWNADNTTADSASGTTATTHLAGTHLGADHAAVVDRSVDDSIDGTLGDHSGTAIPVIEENVRVGKREVNTGRVRVVSRVTERPVEETVTLREEHAHIERRPVDRAVDANELGSFKAGSIEIQETAEEVVVEKSARVVEEVIVGKQASEHQQTVHETVRRTDVDVETDPHVTSNQETLGNTKVERLRDR